MAFEITENGAFGKRFPRGIYSETLFTVFSSRRAETRDF